MIKLSLAKTPGSSGPSTPQRRWFPWEEEEVNQTLHTFMEEQMEWTPVESRQSEKVSQQDINAHNKTVDCCVAQEDFRVVGEVSDDCLNWDDADCPSLWGAFALEQIVLSVPTPKMVKPLKEDLVPAILLCIKTIQSHLFWVLFSIVAAEQRSSMKIACHKEQIPLL